MVHNTVTFGIQYFNTSVRDHMIHNLKICSAGLMMMSSYGENMVRRGPLKGPSAFNCETCMSLSFFCMLGLFLKGYESIVFAACTDLRKALDCGYGCQGLLEVWGWRAGCGRQVGLAPRVPRDASSSIPGAFGD